MVRKNRIHLEEDSGRKLSRGEPDIASSGDAAKEVERIYLNEKRGLQGRFFRTISWILVVIVVIGIGIFAFFQYYKKNDLKNLLGLPSTVLPEKKLGQRQQECRPYSSQYLPLVLHEESEALYQSGSGGYPPEGNDQYDEHIGRPDYEYQSCQYP